MTRAVMALGSKPEKSGRREGWRERSLILSWYKEGRSDSRERGGSIRMVCPFVCVLRVKGLHYVMCVTVLLLTRCSLHP